MSIEVLQAHDFWATGEGHQINPVANCHKDPQRLWPHMAAYGHMLQILAHLHHIHHPHPSGFGSGCSKDLLLSRPYSQYLRGGSVLGSTVNSHTAVSCPSTNASVTAFVSVPSRRDEDLCSLAEVEEDTEASCKGWPCWSAAVDLPGLAEEMRRGTS